jgi:hypothetical protein
MLLLKATFNAVVKIITIPTVNAYYYQHVLRRYISVLHDTCMLNDQ